MMMKDSYIGVDWFEKRDFKQDLSFHFYGEPTEGEMGSDEEGKRFFRGDP